MPLSTTVEYWTMAKKASVSDAANGDMSSDASKKMIDLMKLLEQLGCSINSETGSISSHAPVRHEFWDTQPVPQTKKDLKVGEMQDGAIDVKKIDEISNEAIKLPEGYNFVTLNVDSSSELDELYELLCENYVEDYDSLFRFDYSREFLIWALKSPGWRNDWHVGLRHGGITGKLVGFIAAIPASFRIRRNQLSAVEVNFLCVEKALRAQRFAPRLIQEVTRRVNSAGIFQALYTAGSPLTEPISVGQYFHRPLNFENLLKSGFTYLPEGKTLEQMVVHYRPPKPDSSYSLHLVGADDVPLIHRLLNGYLDKFELAQNFELEECKHWLLPLDGIVYSYLMKPVNGDAGVDFFSFYSIPSTILKEPNMDNENEVGSHDSIKVAYLFYYAVSQEHRLVPLLKAALHEAAKLGFDVLNCLNVMDCSDDVLKAVKFGAGDGKLRFYLYNWRTAACSSNQVGLVML